MVVHLLVHLCQLLTKTEEQVPYYTPGKNRITVNIYKILDMSVCLEKDL